MIIEVVSDVIKSLNSRALDNNNALHDNVLNLMGETAFTWRKDYTIAVAKDDSKTKVANFMVCDRLDETEQTFKVKREKDFWKKLQPRAEYKAVVECSLFSRDTPLCSIETVGRDIMRSRKEVPTVASLGFLWVVHVGPQENLDSLFSLYFKEDYITLNQDEAKYYIGWTDNLKGLDMRNFICDPTAEKVTNEIVDFSTELEYDSVVGDETK